MLLAYAGPFCLLVLARRPSDPRLLWHARHGLVLMLSELALLLAFAIVALALVFLGGGILLPLLILVGAILALAMLALHGLLAAAALSGERILVPGVSHFVDRF